jgi:hypothetical protein
MGTPNLYTETRVETLLNEIEQPVTLSGTSVKHIIICSYGN